MIAMLAIPPSNHCTFVHFTDAEIYYKKRDGSDRNAEQWSRDYAVEGISDIELHHIYRAMAWLGEQLPANSQFGATPFAPRCTKDLIEEALFAQRRDLFSGLDLVFFDTTSIYFEGQGGETIGQYGNSKDHRPDLKQMVVGAVLDSKGNPICCELSPGNTADVKTLIPIVGRLKSKFGIGRICIVADAHGGDPKLLAGRLVSCAAQDMSRDNYKR